LIEREHTREEQRERRENLGRIVTERERCIEKISPEIGEKPV